MPAKTTIRTAEKRVITHEMKTLGRNYKKILSDALKAKKANKREMSLASKKFLSTDIRINERVERETKAIERRMAILEGRL